MFYIKERDLYWKGIKLENLNELKESFFSSICGKLLGDGCITCQVGRSPRFQFIHKLSDFEWCYYCYQQLKPFIPHNPPIYRKIQDARVSQGFTESYMVQSKTSNIITYLESIWYQNRRKIVPFNYLDKFLDAKALAWWYLDDGHLKIENKVPRKIILSTDNFKRKENQRLIDLIEQKFSLYFSLDGQNRLVIYNQLQIYYFYRLVEPFLPPVMERKMIKMNSINPRKSPKRTTICLPKDIYLSKPTFEVNSHLCTLPNLLNIFSNRDSFLDYYKKYPYI